MYMWLLHLGVEDCSRTSMLYVPDRQRQRRNSGRFPRCASSMHACIAYCMQASHARRVTWNLLFLPLSSMKKSGTDGWTSSECACCSPDDQSRCGNCASLPEHIHASRIFVSGSADCRKDDAVGESFRDCERLFGRWSFQPATTASLLI